MIEAALCGSNDFAPKRVAAKTIRSHPKYVDTCGSWRGGEKKVVAKARKGGIPADLDRDPRAGAHSQRLLAEKNGGSEITIDRSISANSKGA